MIPETIRTQAVRLFSNSRVIMVLFILVAVFLTLQNIGRGETKIFSGDETYTYYNNYIIFKNAWFHLLSGQDLYIHYPEIQWDLYKYSPSFAMAMGALAYLPDWAGLMLWNLLNVLILFFCLKHFRTGPPANVFMQWFLLNELFTSVLNSQSNPMIAGLILAAFACFEKGQVKWAALFIVSTFYIKVFGILAAAMFLFYPKKWQFILWGVLWTILIGLLPLFIVSPEALLWQYENWLRLLSEDHSGSLGYSVMGVLNSWFGVSQGKDLVVLTGLVLLMVPFLFTRSYSNPHFRLQWLASLLIWLVIFNHKAESPTYIIAMAGIAVWAFSMPSNRWVIWLTVIAFVFTSLGPTDLFPAGVRHHFFEPYSIKAVPCILIWIYLTVQMIREGLINK